MKKIVCLLITTFCLLNETLYAQQAQTALQNQISINQGDINVQNGIITNSQATIVSANGAITTAQAQIAIDNAAIATDQAEIALDNSSSAKTAAGVNWDYFVSLEPQIPFATWSKVDTGINWTSMVPLIGINCGGITEANVNWTNWGNCESKGMTPGLPYGGKNTGIAAFWCGNGSISGTC